MKQEKIMQKNKKQRGRFAAAFLAAVLAMTMLVQPVLATETEPSAEPKPVEAALTASSITVKAPTGDDYGELSAAGVTLDFYKVASAEQLEDADTYVLKWGSDFTKQKNLWNEITEKARKNGMDITAADIDKLTQALARVILKDKKSVPEFVYGETTSATVPADAVKLGDKYELGTDPGPGMYLVIAHGAINEYLIDKTRDEEGKVTDAPISTAALGDTKLYQFAPMLVTVPQRDKASIGTGSIVGYNGTDISDGTYTVSMGNAYFDEEAPKPWENDLEITLKVGVIDLAGSLKVTKKVTGSYQATENDTYTFTVKCGNKYVAAEGSSTDTAAYSYTELSETETTYTIHADETLTFDDLPVGEYTVTEKPADKTGYALSTTYKVGGEAADTATAEIKENETAEVEITNHYRDAQLTITKTIKDVDAEAVADGVTITVVDKDGHKLLDNVKVTETPFTKSESTYTAVLKSTDSADYAQYIVPDGEYTVTETVEVPELYSLTESKYEVTAKENVAETEAVSGTGYTFQLTGEDTSLGEIDYTNKYSSTTGSLEVKKTVTGSYTPTENDTYTFTVMSDGKYVTADGSGTAYTFKELSETKTTYTVQAGKAVSFSGLPEGKYTVTEEAADKTGYTLTTTYKVGTADPAAAAEAEVVKGETAEVEIINHYRDAQLTITKTIKGVDAEAVADGITITAEDKDGNKLLDGVKLTEAPFTKSGSTYTAVLKSTDSAGYAQYIMPDGEYTVTETVEVPELYSLDSSKYKVTAKENVAETDAASGTGYEFQLTDKDTSAGEIDFTNEYSSTTGGLEVEKKVTGSYKGSENEYTFTVMSGGKYVKADGSGTAYTFRELSEAKTTYTVQAGKKVTFSGLPEDTYTVTEEAADKTGYALAATYKVGGRDAAAAEAEVVRGETAKVVITNHYRDAQLTVTKTIKGVDEADTAAVAEMITITVKDKDGHKLLDGVKLTEAPFTASGNKYTAVLKSIDSADYAQYIVPDGEYTVTETVTAETGEYALKSSKYAVKAKEDVKETDAVSGTGYTFQLTDKDTSAGEIDFTNEYGKVVPSLTVKKTVSGSYKGDGTYEFTVMSDGKYVVAEGSKTAYTFKELSETETKYTIRADETLSFAKLPAGKYTVTEKPADKPGYVLSTTYKVGGKDAQSADVEIVDGKTADVEIINPYRDAQLTVTKTIKGVDEADMKKVAEKITITVEDKDGHKLLDGVKLTAEPFTASGATYTAVLKSTDSAEYAQYIVADGTYKVTETVTDSDPYILKSSKYAVTAKEDVKETDAKSGESYTFQLTDKDTSAGEIDFTNEYEKPVPPGEVLITKVDVSRSNQGLKGATLQLKDADGKVILEWTSDGSARKVEGLQAGAAYTIVETVKPANYEEEKGKDGIRGNVTFVIGTDGKVTLSSSTGEIRGTNEVLVKNAPQGFRWPAAGGNPPKTGDTTNVIPYVVLLAAAAAVLVIVLFIRKRKKEI